jgi:hypothetical protein
MFDRASLLWIVQLLHLDYQYQAFKELTTIILTRIETESPGAKKSASHMVELAMAFRSFYLDIWITPDISKVSYLTRPRI